MTDYTEHDYYSMDRDDEPDDPLKNLAEQLIKADLDSFFDTGNRNSGPFWISGAYSDGFYARAGNEKAGPFKTKDEAAKWVMHWFTWNVWDGSTG